LSKNANPIKLHQFSKKGLCYYCGNPPPNKKEHVPPHTMFSDFDHDSLTVPGCEKHNLSKSLDDRAIVTAIIMGAAQVRKYIPESNLLTPNVIKAVEKFEHKFPEAKNEVENRDFLLGIPPESNFSLPYTQGTVRAEEWIRQLTAALVWSVTGKYNPKIDWDNAWAWSPNYFRTPGPIELEEYDRQYQKNKEMEEELNSFDWLNGWSPRPRKYPEDIYSFDICFLDKPQQWGSKKRNLWFKHRFYNKTSIWFIGIMTPSEIKGSIEIINN
jgi:hypothetical protein